MFEFIGTTQVPALHRILSNAHKEGWAIKKLRSKLQLAAAGEYTARNYSQYEIDLAILLYELGGGGAVHAMNHSIFVLPSLKTIQPHRRQHKITLSIHGLKFSDISQNISALFGSRISFDDGTELAVDVPPTRYGHTLSFDELATERRIDYMTATDDMGGFCLEHLDGLETVKVGKDIRTVEAAVAAVRDGKVHIAHEASVGAISSYSRTNYGARPVYVASTCKKGTWKDLLRTMLTVVEAWKRSPDGEAKHGQLFDVASDGCPKRRLALFVMCMHSEILPGNPLYEFICNLPGFNRRVGRDNLTQDFDYRHDIKRWLFISHFGTCPDRDYIGWCSLLCSPDGMAVKNVCINRDLLLHWLEKLPSNDWSKTSIHVLLNPPAWSETSVFNLLNPKDAQDVPRAVKLLLSIVALRDLESDDFDPSEAAEFEALCLLGEACDALLQPFIDPDLSLSQQIESLTKFSHLICALYVQNGTSFMPNQLYSDLQMMVKNAILLVPKTRIINSRLGVYICLLGDDVLESLFGRSRMIGGHSPNCSIGELRDRFGSAINLDCVYAAHPELERKPRRLKLVRTRDLDHLRPERWGGEVSAGSCDIEICYKAGAEGAVTTLWKYGIRFSFTNLWKRPKADLLRPLGGKYPAISPGVDRSMVNLSSNPAEETADIDPDTVNPNNPLLYIDFDEIIAREAAEGLSEPEAHSLFAEIDSDGHLTHKKAVIRTLFDMTHDSQTSHDRLARIRGFTIGGKTWSHETPEDALVSNVTHFRLGNIFTTLLCFNGTHLGLAVAKCTLIKKCVPGTKAASISAIPLGELTVEGSPYMISGQVLSLVPVDAVASEWLWDGQFISFSRKASGKSGPDNVARIANLQFTVSSRIIDPIHKFARESPIQAESVDSEREKTWVFSNQHILDSWSRLWTSVLADKSLHDKFATKFTGVANGAFPYQAARSAGNWIPSHYNWQNFDQCSDYAGVIYSRPIAGTPIEVTNSDRQKCRICDKPVKDTDRQMHVGTHILKSILGIPDPDIIHPVSPNLCDRGSMLTEQLI